MRFLDIFSKYISWNICKVVAILILFPIYSFADKSKILPSTLIPSDINTNQDISWDKSKVQEILPWLYEENTSKSFTNFIEYIKYNSNINSNLTLHLRLWNEDPSRKELWIYALINNGGHNAYSSIPYGLTTKSVLEHSLTLDINLLKIKNATIESHIPFDNHSTKINHFNNVGSFLKISVSDNDDILNIFQFLNVKNEINPVSSIESQCAGEPFEINEYVAASLTFNEDKFVSYIMYHKVDHRHNCNILDDYIVNYHPTLRKNGIHPYLVFNNYDYISVLELNKNIFVDPNAIFHSINYNNTGNEFGKMVLIDETDLEAPEWDSKSQFLVLNRIDSIQLHCRYLDPIVKLSKSDESEPYVADDSALKKFLVKSSSDITNWLIDHSSETYLKTGLNYFFDKKEDSIITQSRTKHLDNNGITSQKNYNIKRIKIGTLKPFFINNEEDSIGLYYKPIQKASLYSSNDIYYIKLVTYISIIIGLIMIVSSNPIKL